MSAKVSWKLLFQLFWSFLKIAPITFGGGYAMIPMIKREIIERRLWLNEQDMGNVLSVAGSAPGGIGTNVATFIGYRLAGIRGAVCAVIGITLPTLLIVLTAGILFTKYQEQPQLAAAFAGIRIAVVGLIALAAIQIGKSAVYDVSTYIMAALTVAILLFLPIHPILVIVGGILGGIVIVKMKAKLHIAVKLEKNS